MSAARGASVRPAEAAVLVGLSLGLAESVAAFATGRHPPEDAAALLLLGVAIAGILGAPTAWALRRVGLGGGAAVPLGVLLAVVVLQGLRSPGGALLAGTAALALGILWRRRGLSWTLPPMATVAVSVVVLGLGTAVSVCARTPWAARGRTREALVAGAALLCGVAAAAALRRAPAVRSTALRQSLAATSAIVVSAGFLAAALGTRPPVLPRARVGRAAGERPPSVLMVVLDTVRRDRTSLYGYGRPTTPNLERLARRSVVFHRAWASGSHSLPSHASLLTGLRPSEHGAHSTPRPHAAASGYLALRSEVATFPEVLARQGYVAAGVSANAAIFDAGTGLSRRFPLLAATARRACAHVPLPFALVHRAGGANPPWPCYATWNADHITRAASTWLAELGPSPYFLLVNYFDAHGPYRSPDAFRRRFPPPPGSRDPEGGYDASVAYVDAALGGLLEALERSGRRDDTIVVVTSDHGELLGEGGRFGHPGSTRDEILRVPLLIALPGAGRRVDVERHVAHHDVWRLVEAARGGAPPERLADERALPEPVVVSEVWASAEGDPRPRFTRVAAEGRFKLVERIDGTVSLFDLEADPSVDLARAAAALPLARLADMRSRLPRLVEPPARSSAPASPEQLEALRALGYLAP